MRSVVYCHLHREVFHEASSGVLHRGLGHGGRVGSVASELNGGARPLVRGRHHHVPSVESERDLGQSQEENKKKDDREYGFQRRGT